MKSMYLKINSLLKKLSLSGTIVLLLTAGAGCLVQYVPVLSEASYQKMHLDLQEETQPEAELPPDLEMPDFYLSQGFGILEQSEHAVQTVAEEVPEETVSDPGQKPYPESWNLTGGTVQQVTYGEYAGTRFFRLSRAGQVQNKTALSNSSLYDESHLLPEFQIQKDGSPQVLIMHTHTTESFEPYERTAYDAGFNYRTTDNSKNVVMIGDKIAEQLETAGIGVIHDSTLHDYPSYTGSYERSAETVKNLLIQYPSIKVVLDIHRDAIGGDGIIKQPIAEIDGKKSAQIMIISGCDDGSMNMPDYLKNFRFACLLQQQLESDYPGLTRPVLFDYRKYNQDLTTGSLLIEVGSHGNTLEQVAYAGELLGSSLVRTLEQLEG
ncbi:MAG: stage II sporulation protein P [Ruminococcus sp.]|nr:stage II sporulation protein P [Ruminococcus sp.]